jgi:hypothetical protein
VDSFKLTAAAAAVESDVTFGVILGLTTRPACVCSHHHRSEHFHNFTKIVCRRRQLSRNGSAHSLCLLAFSRNNNRRRKRNEFISSLFMKIYFYYSDADAAAAASC